MAGGNLQTSMSGSCAVCVDGVLYLFGGHHARGNTNRVQLSWCLPMCRCCTWNIFSVAILFAVLFWRRCFALCSADLPAPPQSLQLCLGRNEGSERTFSFLQGQAGLLGLQEQVRHKFFVWPLNFALHKQECQMSVIYFSVLTNHLLAYNLHLFSLR